MLFLATAFGLACLLSLFLYVLINKNKNTKQEPNIGTTILDSLLYKKDKKGDEKDKKTK